MLDIGGRQSRRRRRGIRALEAAVAVPVVLALLLIGALLFDVVTDTVSWQVIEPAGSGRSFSFTEGFAAPGAWERVMRLELAARGISDADADALLADPDERRVLRARNRVELMPWVNGRPFRWLVTTARDDLVADVPLIGGALGRRELLASAEAGQVVVLNAWLDAGFLSRNASRSPMTAVTSPTGIPIQRRRKRRDTHRGRCNPLVLYVFRRRPRPEPGRRRPALRAMPSRQFR